MEKQEECFDEECGYDLMVWVETTKSFDEFEFSLAQIIAPVQIDMGYFDLELSYRNVVRVGSTLKALKAVASDPSTEALHDEVDFAEPGGWVHRILFRPYREVTVVFAQLGLRMVPRKTREFRRSDVFVKLPNTALQPPRRARR
jgi:hypothetical protein